jgi:cephalosporin hydroxylase
MNEERFGKIEGWIFLEEGRLLHDLAAHSTGTIVEIGSWKGRSSYALSQGSEAGMNFPVVCIDHFTGSVEHRETAQGPVWTFPDFYNNIQGCTNIVTMITDSIQASKIIGNDLGLVFIDGSHDYESVKADFDAWFPKIKIGGFVALHDTNQDVWGAKRLVKELLTDPRCQVLGAVISLAVARKVQ